MNKYFSLFLLASLLPGCACKKEKQEEVIVQETTEQGVPISAIKEIRNEDELKQYDKAVVKFYTQWCGACKMSTPAVQKLAQKYPDITFLAVDIDEEGDLRNKYHTQGVPTFMVFKNGNRTATILGFNENKLEAELQKLAGEKEGEKKEAPIVAAITEIQDKAQLDKAIKENKKVFVQFYGDWCGFCKMISPDVEKLAQKYGKDIKFVKVEITDKQDIADEHQIQGVPAFATFENSTKKDSFSGADKEQLKKVVKKLAQAS